MTTTTLGWGLTGLISLLHFYILVLEMFRWDSAGPRVFGVQPQALPYTRWMAANQGLYNGFLAAGLAWGVWLGVEGRAVQTYFLACVAVAGLYAGMRIRKTLWIQTAPALLALALLWVS